MGDCYPSKEAQTCFSKHLSCFTDNLSSTQFSNSCTNSSSNGETSRCDCSEIGVEYNVLDNTCSCKTEDSLCEWIFDPDCKQPTSEPKTDCNLLCWLSQELGLPTWTIIMIVTILGFLIILTFIIDHFAEKNRKMAPLYREDTVMRKFLTGYTSFKVSIKSRGRVLRSRSQKSRTERRGFGEQVINLDDKQQHRNEGNEGNRSVSRISQNLVQNYQTSSITQNYAPNYPPSNDSILSQSLVDSNMAGSSVFPSISTPFSDPVITIESKK